MELAAAQARAHKSPSVNRLGVCAGGTVVIAEGVRRMGHGSHTGVLNEVAAGVIEDGAGRSGARDTDELVVLVSEHCGYFSKSDEAALLGAARLLVHDEG